VVTAAERFAKNLADISELHGVDRIRSSLGASGETDKSHKWKADRETMWRRPDEGISEWSGGGGTAAAGGAGSVGGAGGGGGAGAAATWWHGGIVTKPEGMSGVVGLSDHQADSCTYGMDLSIENDRFATDCKEAQSW